MIDLRKGDCLEVMKEIPDESIDLVLCDLPYGTTRNKWDCVIPFEPLWEQYRRIIKPNGAICLHADMPFAAKLVCSALDIYRYEIVWTKEQGSDFLNANRKPLKAHETIQVFYKHQPTYNKQKTEGKPYKAVSGGHSSNWGDFKTNVNTDCPDGMRNPTTVLKFNREKGLHPTQKPVPLCEWFIKTYTNEGGVVLDNCMGSGSTGVACVHTDRKFIGIENDEKYFEMAKERIYHEAEKERVLSGDC